MHTHLTLSDTNLSYSPFIVVSDEEGEAEEGEGNTAYHIYLHKCWHALLIVFFLDVLSLQILNLLLN